MNDKRIAVDGHDITEGVQALYDMVLGSLDFGSGFLSEDELVPVFKAAIAAGFDTSQLEKYLADSAATKRMRLWEGQNPRPTVGHYVPGTYDQHPEWKEWVARRDAACSAFHLEEAAALREAYGLTTTAK